MTIPPDLQLDEQTVKQTLETLADLRRLSINPGWVYIKQVLASQAEQKYSMLGRSPLRNVEDVLAAAELRGEAQSHEILMSLVEFLIASMEAHLSAIGVEEEDHGTN
jgi:hypothetical protein